MQNARALTDAEFDSTLREFKGWWCGWHFAYLSDSDDDLNVFNVEHDDDGLRLNTDNGHPDNRFNADNRVVFAVSAQISSFLSCHFDGRVLFCKLSVPTAKHSANFGKRFG